MAEGKAAGGSLHALNTGPLDAVTCSPDELGEHLRRITFVGEGFGCYMNFDIRPHGPLHKRDAIRLLGWDPDEEWDGLGYNWDVEEPVGGCFYHPYTPDVLVSFAYLWDGDGRLVFRIWDRSGCVRTVENSDCKKDCDWKDRHD